MKNIRDAALAMLRSIDFFSLLRGAMRRVGLPGEEKFGVGTYFVATSRFHPNPLRLCLREKTKGSASYVVRKVSKLLPAGSVVQISPVLDEAWSRFAKAPEHRVAFVSQWWEPREDNSQAWIDIRQNKLIRVLPVKKDGRVVEECLEVEAPFVCVSVEHPSEVNSRCRWLTIYLPKPPQRTRLIPSSIFDRPLEGEELSVWHQVQQLLQERAQLPIVLPEWGDVVVEQMCEDERSSRHVPAFIQAWKTMCLLRSFQPRGDEVDRVLRADFADFAATALLVKNVFWEGRWIPSTAKIFNGVFPVGERSGLIHPLTGKDVQYIHRDENPVRWETLA